jgi:outer membrane translocation and assembly module TamA
MARSFTGRGRILTSTEIRWTPPLEAFTVAPALAVFAGAGRISDQPGFGGDGLWKTGAGIGLRFGMTRSPTGLVNHLSVSHPVGDKGGSWLISLGAKQSL